MKEDRVAPLKDIDRLKKRSRSRRNIVEKGGSLTLATSGLVGLFFLLVLVWQIALPTFIEGETGGNLRSIRIHSSLRVHHGMGSSQR